MTTKNDSLIRIDLSNFTPMLDRDEVRCTINLIWASGCTSTHTAHLPVKGDDCRVDIDTNTMPIEFWWIEPDTFAYPQDFRVEDMDEIVCAIEGWCGGVEVYDGRWVRPVTVYV